jgi:hypothetical protein
MKHTTFAAVCTLFSLALAGTAQAQSPVPVFIKRPELVTNISKNTDAIADYLRHRGKKELAIVADESAAKLTLELVSLTRNAGTGISTSNVVGRTVLTSTSDGFVAVVRVCIPAKDHCEEFTGTSPLYESMAAIDAGDQVKKFAKDNAAALQ